MDKTNATRASLATLTAALLAGAGTGAQSAEPPQEQLTRPESSVSLGAGYVSSDNQQFGQYNGMTDKGFYGLFDIDWVRRHDGNGTWLSLTGRNLGLRDRDLRVEFGPQGDWNAFVDYSQIPRFYPYTITTGLSGIGGASQTISGTGLRSVELETERKRITLGFDKWLPAGFDLKLRYQDERKDGARSTTTRFRS
ncbi:MAG: MtrB/PioB family outer membrane beta-barrel protein [Pirellulaceae bacterium]|nr:MtrB/PioB family outer membrane beta-barrel protein [Pirellulaceae bacterium]